MSAGLVLAAAAGGALLGPVLETVAEAVPARQPVWSRRPSLRLAGTLSLVTASLWGLVTQHVGAHGMLPAQLWLAALAVMLVVTDVRHCRLPNLLVLPGGVGLALLLVLGALLDRDPAVLLGGVVAAAGLFAFFLAAALVSPAGMGMGDVKLVAVLGLALGCAGLDTVVLAILGAFVLHAVLSVALLVTRRAGRHTALPLGPALIIGTALSLGWFEPIQSMLL